MTLRVKAKATHTPHVRCATAHRLLLQALLCIAIFFVSFFFSPGIAHAQENQPSLYVNLQEFPLYLKRGFNPQDAIHANVDDGSWLKKFPFSNVIISKLGLPGLPKRVFLSPFAQPEEEFTFVIPFTLNSVKRLAKEGMPGLFLAAISDNWQVYLNGVLVRSELFLDGDSLRIQTHRSKRDVFFPLPVNLLREGDNLLAFRIVGDPTDKTVGFQYSAPFYIGEYDAMQKRHSETVTMILIGGYLLVGMYHFLLFAIRRKDTSNMYCGAFSALMGLYVLSRTHGIYTYIADTALVVKLEFFCAFMLIPALGAFAQSLCSGKTSAVTKAYSALFVFLALSQLVLPRPYGSDALVVLQWVGIAALLYILIDNILLVFIREVRTQRKQYAQRGAKAPGIGYFLTETYSGNLLLAVGMVVAGITVDIVDSLFFHYAVNLSRYSFYFFMMTVTLMLARIYGKLNNALEAKTIFLANMSHEIRTPMNAIMGMAEQIIRADPPEAIRGKTEQIKQAGNILISIINDILDFSRLGAGKMQIVNREYHFLTLIYEVTGIIGPELARKDIQFVVVTDPTIPQTLIGDAPRIRQILFNLLWNAVKFTSHGKIEFRVERKDRGKELGIVFSVSDTGLGIKQENLPNIFTEFYRLDSSGRVNTEGTGLGLTICKNLCQLMGGEIGVQSEYGKGSTFTAIVPQQPGTGEIAPEAAKEPTLLEQGVTLPGVLVLIVDDLPSNRQVMAGLLQPYGMEIHTAANGREALERAALTAYDIVFMDHVMDDAMDGVAAMLALRTVPGHARTPVVAVTAHAMTGMREFFMEHGFLDYISKPIDPLLLDAVLATWLPKEKRIHMPIREQTLQEPLPAPALVGAVKAELALQMLDLLNHYHWHFANTLPTDMAYCRKFSVLLHELTQNVGIPATLRGEVEKLAQAGQQGDTETIRHGLPDLYNALVALLQPTVTGEVEQCAQRQDVPAEVLLMEREEDALTLRNSLLGLKEALETGNAVKVDALMAQLRDAPFTASHRDVRELYFLLYDMLMMGDMEKAAGALALWAQFFRHEA